MLSDCYRTVRGGLLAALNRRHARRETLQRLQQQGRLEHLPAAHSPKQWREREMRIAGHQAHMPLD